MSIILDGMIHEYVKGVEVVKVFEDTFSEDLPNLPPDRELKF